MKKWLKRLGVVLGVLLLLVVVLLVVVTRPAFINSVIVPRASKALQTDIRIGSLEFNPFSRLQAGDVRVGPDDAPLLEGKLMRVRYGLLSALFGQVRVDEVRLDDTVVHVVKRADGSMNLPVFPPSKPRKYSDDEDDDDPSKAKTAALHVADVRLSGLSFVYEQRQGPGQEPILARISNLSLAVPEVAGGKDVTMKLGGQIDALSVGGVSGVQGALSGECRVGLWPNLMVSGLDLALRITLSQGKANDLDLAGRELRLDVQVAAERGAYVIRRVTMSEVLGGRPEATLALSGRAQLKPADVQLELVADPIESAVFSLVGALLGDVSFGAASGTYRAKIAASSPQRLRLDAQRMQELPWTVAVTGKLDLRALSPTSVKWGVHDVAPFNASFEHDLTWRTDSRTLEVRVLAAHAGTADHEMLTAELSRPLTLDFAGKTPAAAQVEAVLALKARGIGLNTANLVLPPGLPLAVAAGTVDADAELSVAQQGAAIGLVATLKVAGAQLLDTAGGRGAPFAVEAHLGAKVTDLRRVEADTLSVSLRPQGAPAAEVKASAHFDLDKGGEGTAALVGLRESLLALLPASLVAFLPLERFALDGEVRWQAGKGFQPLTTDTRVGLSQVRLRGQEGTDDLAGTLALQAEMKADEVAVRSAALDLSLGGKPALQLTAQGALGLTQAAGTSRTVTLSSDLIDVDRLLAFAKPVLSPRPAAGAAPAAGATAAAEPPVPAAAPRPAPAAPSLPPLNLALNLDLRKIVFNSRTVAVTGAATLADAAELKALVLRLPTGSLTIDALLKPEGADWRTRLSVSAAGEALAELAAWAGKPLPGDPLRGTTLLLRLDGAAAPDASRMRLDAMEVKLSLAGQSPMLGVGLAKPLTLAFSKEGAVTWTATELTVTAAKFPLTMANAGLPADAGLSLDAGVLDAALAIVLRGEALSADVRGTFAVADLAGRRGEQVFSAIRVEGAVEAQTEGKDHASLSKLTGTVSAAGNQALAFSAVGTWDRAQGSSGNLEMTVDVPVALKAAAMGSQAAMVQALTLTLKAKAQVPPENAPIRADLELAATDIRLADAAGKTLPSWALQLAAVAVVQKDRVALDSLTFRAQAGEKALANLSLSGSFVPSPGRNDLKLTGDLLDLTGLLGVAVGAPPAADPATPEKGATPPPPTPQPAVEPGPFDTGALAVVAVVDLRNVIYGELKNDVACTLRLENSVLTIDPIKGLVSGSPLAGSVKANLAVQGFDYSVNLTLGELDMAPFLKTFAADLAPSVQGALTGVSLEVAGQGITRPSLQRTLHGRFETSAHDVVLQGLSGQAELAKKLDVSELEKIRIAKLDLKTRIQDGKIHVETCREVSPEHTLTVTGAVGLDDSLALDVGLGVGGALQTQLGKSSTAAAVMKYLTKEGDHLVTPAPIPVNGTIAAPGIDYEVFLTRLATTSGTNLLKGLVQDQVGGKTSDSVLGGLLKKTGVTLPGATATTPAAKPAAATTVVPAAAAKPVVAPAAAAAVKPAQAAPKAVPAVVAPAVVAPAVVAPAVVAPAVVAPAVVAPAVVAPAVVAPAAVAPAVVAPAVVAPAAVTPKAVTQPAGAARTGAAKPRVRRSDTPATDGAAPQVAPAPAATETPAPKVETAPPAAVAVETPAAAPAAAPAALAPAATPAGRPAVKSPSAAPAPGGAKPRGRRPAAASKEGADEKAPAQPTAADAQTPKVDAPAAAADPAPTAPAPAAAAEAQPQAP